MQINKNVILKFHNVDSGCSFIKVLYKRIRSWVFNSCLFLKIISKTKFPDSPFFSLLLFPGDTLVKLLMHSSDDVTCVALEALSAIFTNGNLEQKKVIQGLTNKVPGTLLLYTIIPKSVSITSHPPDATITNKQTNTTSHLPSVRGTVL